jgi:hypothetical protein
LKEPFLAFLNRPQLLILYPKLKKEKAITPIVTTLPHTGLTLCNTFSKNLILEIEVVDINGKLMQNA